MTSYQDFTDLTTTDTGRGFSNPAYSLATEETPAPAATTEETPAPAAAKEESPAPVVTEAAPAAPAPSTVYLPPVAGVRGRVPPGGHTSGPFW